MSLEQLQRMIDAAVQQSLLAHFLPPSRDVSMRSVASTSPERVYDKDSLSIQAPDSPAPSHVSHTLSLREVEQQEPGLSEDEGLLPDQPSFTGLFPQALFKSLLFKAVNTAQLGSTAAEPAPSSKGSLDPLFVELSKPVDFIPTAPLFLDVLKKQ